LPQDDATRYTAHAVPALPQRTRVYQCHHLDSTRWDKDKRREVEEKGAPKRRIMAVRKRVHDRWLVELSFAGPHGKETPRAHAA
jgi:hypothetical protein